MAGIAGVHALAGGRAVLGVGRGDSAVAHPGVAVEDLADRHGPGARPVGALGLALRQVAVAE